MVVTARKEDANTISLGMNLISYIGNLDASVAPLRSSMAGGLRADKRHKQNIVSAH